MSIKIVDIKFLEAVNDIEKGSKQVVKAIDTYDSYLRFMLVVIGISGDERAEKESMEKYRMDTTKPRVEVEKKWIDIMFKDIVKNHVVNGGQNKYRVKPNGTVVFSSSICKNIEAAKRHGFDIE